MFALVRQDLERYAKNDGLSFPRVVGIAMKSVETASVEVPRSSEMKLQNCLDLIPNVIDIALEMNIISTVQADSLKKYLGMSKDIIELCIQISHNPAVIQAELAIKKCCIGFRSK
tara:strand:- start:91 stop:435 length:345 start_codon:yes stop_codon:yes gene_type:complete